MAIEDDIELAKKEIANKNARSMLCTRSSLIYKFTNEYMSDPNYIKLVSDNDRVLSVIGSGDQILNAILFGSKKIDAFDISAFPKYYLEFKIAAIKCLSYREFIDLFINSNAFNTRLYRKVLDNMDSDAKEFWLGLTDGTKKLFNSDSISSKDLYESRLFDKSANRRIYAIYNNPYLKDEDSYNLLKEKLHNKVHIHYITGDIFKIGNIRYKNYNFINMSNISNYYGSMNCMGNSCRYKNFVTNLNIADDGKILTYLNHFKLNSMSYEYYKKFYMDDRRFILRIVKEDTDLPDALLIRRKVRK